MNQSMMLNVQLRVMIHCKSNSIVLPPGEQEGRSVHLIDTAYADMVAYALSVAESIEIPEPSTYNEAISSDEAAEWIVAMTEEMESLHKNQTWELVKPPRGQKIGTVDNLADIMTNPIPSRKFEYCLELLGFQNSED